MRPMGLRLRMSITKRRTDSTCSGVRASWGLGTGPTTR